MMFAVGSDNETKCNKWIHRNVLCSKSMYNTSTVIRTKKCRTKVSTVHVQYSTVFFISRVGANEKIQ